MTMPIYMNCPHRGNSWCLTCVAKLGEQNYALESVVENLKSELADQAKMIEEYRKFFTEFLKFAKDVAPDAARAALDHAGGEGENGN